MSQYLTGLTPGTEAVLMNVVKSVRREDPMTTLQFTISERNLRSSWTFRHSASSMSELSFSRTSIKNWK